MYLTLSRSGVGCKQVKLSLSAGAENQGYIADNAGQVDDYANYASTSASSVWFVIGREEAGNGC